MLERAPASVLLLALLAPACTAQPLTQQRGEPSGAGGQPVASGEGGQPPTASGGGVGTPPETQTVVAADAPRIWRLSNAQYGRTVDDLLGGGGEIAQTFLLDVGGHGFGNAIDRNSIDGQRAVEYQRAAQSLAEATVADSSRLSKVWPCAELYDDATCVETFVTGFLARAFRRPALAPELDGYRTLFTETRTALDGLTAVQLVIETVLQSPSFLYRTEIGSLEAPDPIPGEVVPLTASEGVSLLSYSLWGAPPDDALRTFASEPADAERLRVEVARLLQDPRALAAFEDFIHGLVSYEDLDNAAPVPGFELDWDAVRGSMKLESRAFLQHLLFSGQLDATFANLVTAPSTFVDARLASVYGVAAPAVDFTQVQTVDERPGLLGQAGVLAAHSLPDRTSPPRRGKLIATRFLCLPVPAPPDNVEIPQNTQAAVTTRQYFETITGPGTCGAGCHAFLNAPGFAFEHYDWVGRFRSDETGAAIDSNVDLTAIGLGVVDGAASLAQQLATSDTALDCFTRQIYRFVMGRIENGTDQALVTALGAQFRGSGGQIRSVLSDLLTHPALHQRQMPLLQ